MHRFVRMLIIVTAMLVLLVGCATQTLQPRQVRQFAVADIAITEIIDSPLTFHKDMWPDIDAHPDKLAMMPGGTFATAIKTFVIRSGDRVVLIDGGAGKEHYVTKGYTVETLQTLGIKPTDVTDILMTHLDIDHVAGLVSGMNATYPNARLHVSRPEYEAWTKDRGLIGRMPEHKTLTTKIVLPAYANSLRLFDFGETILPGIVAVDATGHTPGHTAYEITSGSRGMLVAGDFMHIAPIQLRTPEYSAVWDAQPQAGETRRRILERLSDSDIMLAAMHIAETGHVRRTPDGGYTLMPAR